MRLKHPKISSKQLNDLVVLNYGRGDHKNCYLRNRKNLEEKGINCKEECDKCFFNTSNSTEFEVREFIKNKFSK